MGSEAHRTDAELNEKCQKGKKLQRIRIKSWIIITNSYIIKTSDERWMNEWMEITDTELCSAALWWWFLLHWGVEKNCERCCLLLSYGNKFVSLAFSFFSDLWFMIDCKKSSHFYVFYCINAIDLMMTLFCTKLREKCTLKCHINYKIFFHWQLHPSKSINQLMLLFFFFS